ncbi:MAG TPA: hypothetical protein VJB14_09410 [Planctomycetota bacterium]|nr:hypothetical protein [Planctomycetota bacterium]
MADWLEKYRKDLQTLRSSADMKIEGVLDLSREEQDRLLEPVRSGSGEALDLRTIGQRLWERFHKEIVAGTKEEVKAILRLRPLFERLKKGSEEDWEAFAQMYHELGWKTGERIFRQLNSAGGPRASSQEFA